MHDATHGNDEHVGAPIRININYIVCYKEFKKTGGTLITCKGSINYDTAPVYVTETPEQIDNMIATKYILEGGQQ